MDLKDILNKTAKFSSEIISLDKTPVTIKNGFLSDITSLTLHHKNGEETYLIMKTPLKMDAEKNPFYEMSQSATLFEFNFYEKVYPELKRTMTKLNLPNALPTCYYICATEGGHAMILDDLTRRGLKMPSLKAPIPENDITTILRSLAAVQVGVCALQLDRKASLLELFPFLKVNDAIFGLEKLCEKNGPLCKQNFIKDNPDRAELGDIITAIALDTELTAHFFRGKEDTVFLSHGDVWNNNIFVNEKECVLIDWQCTSGGCPLGDIATLLTFGTDLGPQPSKRFASVVEMYLDFLLEYCGDNAALKEMVEHRIVPVLSDAKMQRMSLQFGVKLFIACNDMTLADFLSAEVANGMTARFKRNMLNIIAESTQ